MVVSGVLVEVERVNTEELRKQHPGAFSQPCHPAAGLRFERVLEKERGV
jgi:hypothetical protein